NYTGQWKDDRKTSTWKYWNDKGRAERMESFNEEGVLHGPSETYNAKGQLISNGSYSNGKPHGKWEYYYDFGGMLRTCVYKDGALNGKSVTYSERGKITEESGYRNNRLHGEYTRFDEKTGKVILKQVYENGKVVKVLEGSPVPPPRR
ncbi:MAG: toxin-antitoxin system YwqK family antitoxin, partial [Bacteroidota bacterium]